jgi:hypothetical protein
MTKAIARVGFTTIVRWPLPLDFGIVGVDRNKRVLYTSFRSNGGIDVTKSYLWMVVQLTGARKFNTRLWHTQFSDTNV